MDEFDKGYAFRGEQRLYQIVARRIAQMIDDNRETPGWRMPAERELAEMLAVSRPVIREAIVALEVSGLVSVKGRARIHILPRLKEARAVGPGFLETADIADLLEARLALDPHNAFLAARGASVSDMAPLRQHIAQMSSGNAETFTDAARRFHLALAGLTANAVLMTMTEDLQARWNSALSSRALARDLFGPELRPLWIGDFHAVVAALEARQPNAAHKAAARHLDHIRTELEAVRAAGAEPGEAQPAPLGIDNA